MDNNEAKKILSLYPPDQPIKPIPVLPMPARAPSRFRLKPMAKTRPIPVGPVVSGPCRLLYEHPQKIPPMRDPKGLKEQILAEIKPAPARISFRFGPVFLFASRRSSWRVWEWRAIIGIPTARRPNLTTTGFICREWPFDPTTCSKATIGKPSTVTLPETMPRPILRCRRAWQKRSWSAARSPDGMAKTLPCSVSNPENRSHRPANGHLVLRRRQIPIARRPIGLHTRRGPN